MARHTDDEVVRVTGAILGWVSDVGWSPDAPNERCARALARPRIVSRLSKEDADGCHFTTTYLEYDRLLDRARFSVSDKHRFQHMAATFVVLKHNGAFPMTKEEFVDHGRGFKAWHDDVLVPARQRIPDSEPPGGRRWFMENRERFEPAFTQGMIELRRRLFADFESDSLRMARGLAMNDVGSVKLKVHERPTTPLPLDQFLGYLRMCNTPDRSVSRYDRDGVLRIMPSLVKGAMDKIYRTDSESPVLFVEDVGQHTDNSPKPDEVADFNDALEAVSMPTYALAARGRQNRAAHAVHDAFMDLATGRLSVRKLARDTGISRLALQRAVDTELVRRRRRA